jgi:hypothetical protein
MVQHLYWNKTWRSIITAYLEGVMYGSQNNGTRVTIQGERIDNLRFAYDIDLIEDSWEALQESVRLLDIAGKDASLNINIAETKTLLFGKTDRVKPVVIRKEEIENIAEFVYLSSLISMLMTFSSSSYWRLRHWQQTYKSLSLLTSNESLVC